MIGSGSPAGTGTVAPERLRHGLRRGRRSRRDSLRIVELIAYAAFVLQFAGLVAFSAFVYHRFTLGIDFAEFSQAFSRIGEGHLDPTCSICGYSYLHSHFELIMWPLSLLYAVFRTTFLLLVVQCASLAGIGAATFSWVVKVVRQLVDDGSARALLAFALIVLVLSPLVYGTVALDFHFEATAALFALLAARDAWDGRPRRAGLWAGLCLLCGDVGGLYVFGVGVSAVLGGRRARWLGVALMAAGVVWIGVIGSLGANKGSFTGQYAYLAGRAALPAGFGAAWVLVKGVVRHPSRGLTVLRGRLHLVGDYLLSGGFLGIATPWGFGVPAVVLLSSSLQQTSLFIGEPFQQVAVTPFVLFGSVWVLALLVGWRREPSRAHSSRPAGGGPRAAVAAVLALVMLGGVAYYAHAKLPDAYRGNAAATIIPSGEAFALRRILSHTPRSAEVIASLPISGRFGARASIHLYDSPASPIPIEARTVVLVLDTAHTLQLASPTQDAAAVSFAQRSFHARVIGSGLDVVAVEWTPPARQTSVVLP